ncbi:MAG: serine/threonine protein kinase [Planctomycetes bacterium]|nr:serine/threonine protein kinase [Planctomycetota bacterium]
MEAQSVDDLLDRLVAEYSDRVARGGPAGEAEILARAPEAHREALQRCFRMIQAGVATAPRAGAPLGPGVRLDRFEIVRELGRGGMAIVYLANQLELRRPVALKVLRPGLALERRNVDRFRREALAIARLQHPHIVQVHAVGEADGWHFLAMEYVEGRTLADVYAELAELAKLARPTGEDLERLTGFRAGGAKLERALCAFLAPVARALGVAHELGLVHRDVKPSNILIHADGRAVIADFGLAKGDGDPGLSLSGEPLGTPYYMSPEQATLIAEPVDRRTDVYSLGVTLFEGLTGRRPYEGDTVLQVLERLRSSEPPSARSLVPTLSTGVDAVVRRAMAKSPSERYPTALELAVDLQAISEGHPPQALAREGSAWKRVGRVYVGVFQLRREYRSARTFLGWPLVHLVPSVAGKNKVAKGWFAYGPQAIGFVALGGVVRGVFAFGALAAGLFAFGGLSLGVFALGGLAVGLLSFGGVSAGQTAIGGLAVGHYAIGGRAHAIHAIDAERHDPEAIEWFTRLEPVLDALPAGEVLVRRVEELRGR